MIESSPFSPLEKSDHIHQFSAGDTVTMVKGPLSGVRAHVVGYECDGGLHFPVVRFVGKPDRMKVMEAQIILERGHKDATFGYGHPGHPAGYYNS